MSRTTLALRSGTALLALVIGSAAAAQDAVPPAASPSTVAEASEPENQGEIVVTGSRIRRNPLDQPTPFSRDTSRNRTSIDDREGENCGTH